MYFVLQTPSLELLVGVKIVSTLWNQRDIFTQIARSFNGLHVPGYYIGEDSKEWKAIEEKVRSKIAALPLPQLYKDRLFHLVKPLGIEIVDWCQYHSGDFKHHQFADLLPRQFCWTMHGTIDYAKTAELMVKDERKDVERRYEFACINGLEDEARELIELVPKERRHACYVSILKNVMRDDFYHLIVLITDNIETDGIDVWNKWNPFVYVSADSFDTKYLIQDHLPSGNRAMCEYLFQTLDQEEQRQILEDCEKPIVSCSYSPTCSLLYYLSLMSEEQQERMFRKSICGLLVCLLRWPAQSLFMEAAKRGWRYASKIDRSTVLLAITLKIRFGFRDYDYSRLFWECWRLIPAEDASDVLLNDAFLESLLHTKREEFIQLSLNEAPSHQILALCTRYHKISYVLMDETVMSEAALMKCNETAALKSSNDPQDEEKRLRSEHLSGLVDLVMKSRASEREKNVNCMYCSGHNCSCCVKSE